MGRCVVYRDREFGGDYYEFTAGNSNLKNKSRGIGNFDDWNDEISSFKIIEGNWEFFEHVDYKGVSVTLGPGNYGWVGDIGLPNDTISSLRLV